MKKPILALAVAIAVCLSIPTGSVASIGKPPPAKHFTSRFIARENAKHAMALELMAWSNGRVSATQFNKDFGAFLATWGPGTGGTQPIPATGGSVTGGAQAPAIQAGGGPSSLRRLNVNQYAESNPSRFCAPGFTCYCGPSAAMSVLQYLQPTSHDLEGVSQDCLAGWCGSGYPYSWKYLETNVQGGETPWFSGGSDWPMSQTFNYWISGSYSGYPYYANYRPTSVTDYESVLVTDIYNGGASTGFPLAGDVEEVQNGLHLPGHPTNLEIEHWIAMFGYEGSGGSTDYVDPAAGSALNWNVAAYNYAYSSSNIYTLVTDSQNYGPFGVVW